jgi:hypothetical protein
MAVCEDCEQEMTEAQSCTVSRIIVGERAVVRKRWRPARGEPDGPCGDCGVDSGGWHHLGCDLEICPLCRGQVVSCACAGDEDGSGPRLRALVR